MRALSVRLSVCLAAMFVASVSGTVTDALHTSWFTYHLFRRAGTAGGASCSVCYGEDCWVMSRARCEYYLLTDMSGEQEDGGVTELDEMMYEMVEDATTSKASDGCIPFISQYTDCTKENTCVGCRRCTCDVSGIWVCNLETNCRPQDDLVVDRRVLVSVIENLTYNQRTRHRRWIHQTTTPNTEEWLYEGKSEVEQDKPLKGNTTEAVETVIIETATKLSNMDNTDLDELLDTIGLKNNKRRKPQLNDEFYNIQDLVEDVRMMKSKDYDDFINLFNGLDGNDTIEETTKVVIDLLEAVNTNDSNNNQNFDFPDGASDLNYDSNQLPINVMKREIPKLNVTGNSTESQLNQKNAKTHISNLTEDVLNPINNMISEKEKEIKYLSKIKSNLEKFIKSYNDTKITLSINNNGTNINNTFSVYKVDFYPESEVNLRKINPDNLNKLLYKLKRDIFEAVSDIKVIQKMSKVPNLPADLQILITALKSYIYNKGHGHNITQNKSGLVEKIPIRRQFYRTKPITTHLVNMMNALDKRLPSPNVLAYLSPTTAKIIKRVIKNNYFDEISITEVKVYDPEYNLTNNLRSVGIHWNRYINVIDNSEPGDLFHALKLLHIGLSQDITKIVDALTLVNFAHSRRMVPIEERIGEELAEQISNNLKMINHKIHIYQNYKNTKQKEQKVQKKKSFLRKIKDLLTGAKKDSFINKLSTPEVMRTISKRRLQQSHRNQMTDYDNTMRKWQDQLNLIPHRSKRSSVLKKLQNRMKNIIPKYLRTKLNPAIDAKKSPSRRQSKDKKHMSRKEKQSSTRKPKATTARTKDDVPMKS